MTDYLQARVLEISEIRIGTEVTIDHAINATVLTVYDAGDFDDDGGQVEIEGVVYTYNTKDDDLATLTLATGLTVAVPADTEVFLYPASFYKEAMCQIDEEDSVMARVPYSLYGALDSMVRDGYDQESVTVYMDGSEWVIDDVIAEQYKLDGGYINEGTIPEPGGEPEVPPGTSPEISVHGTAGALIVESEPVAPGTRIRYYVSTVSGFTPGPTTLYSETQSTILVVTTLPGMTDELLPNTPYYVVAQAVNDAGDSTDFSNQASDTLHMDVLQDEFFTQLKTGFILTGKIQIGQAYISADEGIVIPQPDGGVITFPVNGNFARITAHLIARSLSITNNMTINGDNNQVFGQVTFGEGIVKPMTPPSLSSVNKFYHAFDVLGSNVYQGMIEDPVNSGNWLFPFAFFGTGVRSVMKSQLTWNGDLAIAGIPSAISDFQPFGGMIYASSTSRYVMLGTASNPAGTGVSWYLVTFSRSTISGVDTLTYAGRLEVAGQATFPFQPRMAFDAATGDGYIFYMNENADQKLRSVRFTPTSTPTRDSGMIAYTISLGGKYNIGGAYIGNADFGSKYWVIGLKGSAQMVFAGTPGSFLRAINYEWPRPANVMGITWDGTRFWTFSDSGDIYKHSTNKAASGKTTSPIQARHTWYDGNGTTHETDGGPIETHNLGARQWLRVETDPAPDTDGNVGDPDKADQIRIYISSDGTTTPRLQTADGWASMTPSTNWRPKVRNVLIITSVGDPVYPDNVVRSSAIDTFSTDDIGGSITGTNIPAGTTIVDVINNGRDVQISANATGTGAFISATITPTVDTRSGLFESINNSNTAAPTTNGFAAVGRAPGAFKSTRTDANGPLNILRGDGSGRAGPFQWDSTGKTLTDFGAERPGTIIHWPVANVPLDCALANGQAVPRPKAASAYNGAAGYASSTSEVYKRLWDLFGTAYGSGDGTTTFNLPDYRDRILLGVGTYATGGTSNEGVAYGSRDLQHTHQATMPDHQHPVDAHDHGLGAGTTAAVPSGSGGGQRMTGAGTTGTRAGQTGNVSGTNPPITSSGQAKTGANSIPFHGIYVLIKL